MVNRLQARLCVYSLFVGLLASACTSFQCKTSADPVTFAEVWYSTGGFAPVQASIRLHDDGLAVFTDLAGRQRCARLSHDEDVTVLSEPAEAKRLLDAVRLADAEAAPYGELEMIYVRLDGDEASVPLEVAPDQLRELLRAWEGILSREFGVVAPWVKPGGR